MNYRKLIFLVACIDYSQLSFNCFSAEPDDHDLSVDSLTATQTGGTAGTRKSDSNLIIVRPKTGTAAADLLAKVSGPKPNDQPKWSGTGVVGKDGDVAAKWSGKSSENVTATAPGGTSSVRITVMDVVVAKRTILSKDHTTISGVIDNVNKFIKALKFEKGIVVEGKVGVEITGVDYYNDGERVGNRSSLYGTCSASLGKLAVSLEVPTSFPAIKIVAEAELDALNFTARAECIIDDSKEEPIERSLEGSITLSSGVSASFGAAIGIPRGATLLLVEATGTTQISGGGKFELNGKTVTMAASVSASALKVEGKVQWQAGITVTLAKGEATFGEGLDKSWDPVEIHSFD